MNSIISKIKKMLALAADAGASEGERDIAMRMVHAMMAKHNLNINDVQTNEVEESREEQSSTSNTAVWCRHVSNSIAKLFFCKYYFHRNAKGKIEHRFVGKSSNVATAVLMSNYVINSILTEAKKTYRDASSVRSFSIGAQYKIGDRVKEIMTSKSCESTSTDVAIINLYKTEQEANDAYLKSGGTKLTTTSRRQSGVNMGAFNNGSVFGGKVGLHAQMSGATLRLN